MRRNYLDSANIKLYVADNAEAFADEAAGFFIKQCEESLRRQEIFTVALSGGSTPAMVFDTLAKKYKNSLEWNRIHFFWSDERMVPPHHPRSNYRMAQLHLLNKVPVPQDNIHRFLTERSVLEACDSFKKEIQNFFQIEAGKWPSFDLIFLGLGEDGHTASLFSGSKALKNLTDYVTTVDRAEETRLTFTYPLINAAKEVAVLVMGEEKKEMVLNSLMTPPDREKLPIQGIHPTRGNLSWFLDREAASLL